MRYPVVLGLLLSAASGVASAQEIQAPVRDGLAVPAPSWVLTRPLASTSGRQGRENLRLRALDRPTKGFLIGAALGAGAGVLLGSLACHQDVGSQGCTGVSLRIGILGLGLGGALGALLGSAGPDSEPK